MLLTRQEGAALNAGGNLEDMSHKLSASEGRIISSAMRAQR
jgi:hypothetical protein